jgi:hypothetical protein
MKHARNRSLLDLPDDVSVDIAMIAISVAVGLAAFIYLLAV